VVGERKLKASSWKCRQPQALARHSATIPAYPSLTLQSTNTASCSQELLTFLLLLLHHCAAWEFTRSKKALGTTAQPLP
jgi:hypothetical protein